MKINIPIERILSALLVALALVTYIHNDHTKWNMLGRDAFLTYEASRYDRYAQDPHWATIIISSFIVTAAVFIVYELLSYALTQLLKEK